MNSDLRYHIASLSAVFLALGMGILIGTAFVGTPLVQRQTKLIHQLENNVTSLRQERAQRDNTEKALSSLVPGIITQVLENRRVLLIQNGGYGEAADAAAESLELAGATVVRALLPLEAWEKQAVSAAQSSADQQRNAIRLRQIADLLRRGDSAGLETFRTEGLLAGAENSSGPPGPYRLIVLVGGAQAERGSRPQSVSEMIQKRDLALIESWSKSGVTVVGVEPMQADISFLRIYQTAGIATIDSIDHAVGKITLPFALLGEKDNYGLRPDASRPIPESVVQRRPLSLRPSPSPSALPSLVPGNP